MARSDTTKYFMRDYSAMDGRREIPHSSVVGVETPTLTIEISEREGDIMLRGDDQFVIVPESGNTVALRSLTDRTLPSGVEALYDSEEDRRDADRALNRLHTIAAQLTDAKFTKTAADRTHASKRVYDLLKTIRKVI